MNPNSPKGLKGLSLVVFNRFKVDSLVNEMRRTVCEAFRNGRG